MKAQALQKHNTYTHTPQFNIVSMKSENTLQEFQFFVFPGMQISCRSVIAKKSKGGGIYKFLEFHYIFIVFYKAMELTYIS